MQVRKASVTGALSIELHRLVPMTGVEPATSRVEADVCKLCSLGHEGDPIYTDLCIEIPRFGERSD